MKSFVANLPVFEVLKLGTGENLRSYLADYSPKKRTRVHEAIANTIETEPRRFITRNSGFVIAASDIQIDDTKKTVRLTDPSIINGAQSQGEIKRWAEETYGDEIPTDPDEPPFYVRAEIIVDKDDNEVVETAIARNTATPVKSISQAGARHHLDDLEKSVKKVLPEVQISMSETDFAAFDTRKVLQYARLLMPPSVSGNETVSERASQSFANGTRTKTSTRTLLNGQPRAADMTSASRLLPMQFANTNTGSDTKLGMAITFGMKLRKVAAPAVAMNKTKLSGSLRDWCSRSSAR